MKLYCVCAFACESGAVELSRPSPAVKGPVIALEMNGDGVVEACNNIAAEVFSGTKVRQLHRLFLFSHSSVQALQY